MSAVEHRVCHECGLVFHQLDLDATNRERAKLVAPIGRVPLEEEIRRRCCIRCGSGHTAVCLEPW